MQLIPSATLADIDEALVEQELRARALGRARIARKETLYSPGVSFSPVMARRSLMRFTMATYPDYYPERMHYVISWYLDQVAKGNIRRLIILAPPRHGKSELASVRFPPFYLGKNPNYPIMQTSATALLAEDFSSQQKGIVQSPEGQEIFPWLQIRNDASAKSFWRLAGYRGMVRAAGFGGNIIGFGFKLGLIDDPIASWAEAQSETVRERVWEWYKGTYRHRAEKYGAIVLIMTPWHEDDLAARLMKEQQGLWTVLRLPAIAETQDERDEHAEKYGLPMGAPDPLGRLPGEVLAPHRYPKEEIEMLRVEMGSLVFSALFQGNPRPPEGNIFKSAWFTPEIFVDQDAVPRNCVRVRYWDKAGTEGAGAFTVGLLMAMDEDGIFYIEDVKREQFGPGRRNDMMAATAREDARRYGNTVLIYVEQEPGSGGKESAMITQRMLAGFPVNIDHVGDAKEIRWRPLASAFEAGIVRIVKSSQIVNYKGWGEGGWNKPFVGEMLDLSVNAKYKDQGDAAGGAFNMLTLGKGGMTEKTRQLLARTLGAKGANFRNR